MIRDCFADTGYWIAMAVRQDQLHTIAQDWTLAVTGEMVTTEAVILETANALSRQSWRHSAVRLIDAIRARSDVVVLPWSPLLISRAWTLFAHRADKEWSLVDCGSFVVMQERALTDALAFDVHFEQAGFRALLRQQQPDRES